MGKKAVIGLVTGAPLGDLPSIMDGIKDKYGDIIDVKIFPVPQVDSGKIVEKEMFDTLSGSDVILYDIRGNGKTFNILRRLHDSTDVNMCSILGGSPDILGLTRLGTFSIRGLAERTGGQAEIDYTKLKKIYAAIDKLGQILPEDAVGHAKAWAEIIRYWSNPHERNLKNMLLLAAKKYGLNGEGKSITLEPPIERPEWGIYHPSMDRVFTSLEEYLDAYGHDSHKPTIGILYYGGVHYEVSIVGVKSLIKRLEPAANVIPVFTGGVQNLPALERYFAGVDAIISIIWFRMNGGPMGGDPQKTVDLLAKMDAPVFTPITMYSGDVKDWKTSRSGAGGVEVLATVVFPEMDGCIEPVPVFGLEPIPGYGEVRTAAAIEDRIERVAGRALKRVSLRYKANDEKKVALIIYDYPPGEANVGGAAYLDTFKSLEAVMRKLFEEGYGVKPVNVKESLLGAAAVNSPEFLKQDAARLVKVPVKKYMEWYNGLPEALRMEVERDWGPPPGRIMVSGKDILLPVIPAGNAFICVQPSRGVHEDKAKAYHDKALAPHHQYVAFYMWLQKELCTDAIVHVGTHGTLEFLPGKEVGLSSECWPDVLTGNLPHFYFYHVTNPSEAVIARRRSYGTLVSYAPPSFTVAGLYGDLLRLEDLIAAYKDAVASEGSKEVTLNEIADTCVKLGIEFEGVESLHEELSSMKSSVIPRGLHTLGRTYDDDKLENYLYFTLGREYPEIIADDASRMLIRSYCVEGVDTDADDAMMSALAHGRQIAARVRESDELGALVRGLAGGYTMPNIAGDPIRSPDVFPTGRNSYQFDPRSVPTETAYKRGKEIAESTLRTFYGEHGRYPETVGMILWGFETAKTRGETVGQILAYMGLKVVHGKNWFPSIEVLPLEELGRPRIDVNVNICGFFRDMFPNVVASLSKGISKIAALEEDASVNFVRKHTEALKEKLISTGMHTAEAEKMSRARIFGPPSGMYGTNLTSIVETSNWESEAQLADEYTDNMSSVYGLDTPAIAGKEAFKALLDTTEMVSQVRDTNEYELSDLDHYYEFLGGLSKSVERVRGIKPKVLVSDTTRKDIKVMDASKAVTKGVYTRLLNPEWIDGLLEHDFHGAKKVGDRVEYLIGFAATVGVKTEIFQNVTERLMFDKDMLEALKKNNQYATRDMAKRILEAEKRGYWNASEEDLKRMREIYLSLEEDLEGSS